MYNTPITASSKTLPNIIPECLNDRFSLGGITRKLMRPGLSDLCAEIIPILIFQDIILFRKCVRDLHLMIIHMLTVSGKPRNNQDRLAALQCGSDRRNAAVCDYQITPAEIFIKIILAQVIHILIMLRFVIRKADLGKDPIFELSAFNQFVQLRQQSVKRKFLCSNRYKNHTIPS